MDYKNPVDKVKKWTLAPRQNALKKELLRVYNDPWDMEHGIWNMGVIVNVKE